MQVLVIGATGSIGRLVVDEALAQGHRVRALVRNARAARLPTDVDLVGGDLTQPDTLGPAVAAVDAIVFTHGSDGLDRVDTETIDYGGVRHVLAALRPRVARIALMTSIGVTNRTGAHNREAQAHDWKRRAERLVRASGLPYTIVRPGWFDHHAPDQQRLVLLQGDTRHTGTPRDGVVARRQTAQILVRSLTCETALSRTFELVAEQGAPTANWEGLFASVVPDAPGALDGVGDAPNMPLADEPPQVLADLEVRSS